jgi:hypothetical protein
MKSAGLTRRWRARISVADVGEFVRWLQLHTLAKFLNGDEPGESTTRLAQQLQALARQIVKACLGRRASEPVPPAAAERFNHLAQGAPLAFFLVPGRRTATPRGAYDELLARQRGERLGIVPFQAADRSGLMVSCPDARRRVVKLLVDYFRHASPERLKYCAVCDRWFVDQTRNNARLRCSLGCTWRWWSRDRRRQAGHSRTRRRRTKKHRMATRGKGLGAKGSRR